MKCDYGCGKIGVYKMTNGKNCCSKHYTQCPKNKEKNSKGLKNSYKEGRKNCDHFDGKRGWLKGKTYTIKEGTRGKYYLKDILEGKHPQYSTNKLKKRLIEEGIIKEICSSCGIGPEWQGKKLVHVLDHINGINNDHRIENLRLLCPNCNSQTDTFCGRNKNKRD